MATTSTRTLKLLSIFATGVTLTAAGLADRLGVSPRTVRRDIETLRDLGYVIDPVYGPEGGYRLGRGTRLPFPRRPLPDGTDRAAFVANTHDRGDTVAEWPAAARPCWPTGRRWWPGSRRAARRSSTCRSAPAG